MSVLLKLDRRILEVETRFLFFSNKI